MTQTTVRDRTMNLRVNGSAREISAGSTIADLLATLGIDARMVVVEHNGEIVRDRAVLATRSLGNGDRLEIVHFVGGG
jgi:thiamine biosynthesis protein ThiS